MIHDLLEGLTFLAGYFAGFSAVWFAGMWFLKHRRKL